MLLEAVLRRLEGAPPPRPLLLAALGLLLEVGGQAGRRCCPTVPAHTSHSPPREGLPPAALTLLVRLPVLIRSMQEPPSSGASPHRFTATAVANLAALGLLLALLRRAAWPDQLWGLAAFRELLLQVRRGWGAMPACLLC